MCVYRVQNVVSVQIPDCCPCTKSRLLYVYRVQIDVCVQSPKCRGSTDCCQCTGSWFLSCKEFFFCVQRPDCCPCKASKLYCTETRLLSEYRDQIAVRIQRPYCCPCTATRLLSVYRGVHIFVCTDNNFLSSHELSLFKFKSCLISTLQFLYSKGVPPKEWFDCRIIWWKNNLVQPLVVTLPENYCCIVICNDSQYCLDTMKDGWKFTYTSYFIFILLISLNYTNGDSKNIIKNTPKVNIELLY